MKNDGGEVDKVYYLNIPVGDIVIDAQIRSTIDTEGEAFAALVKSVGKEGTLEPVFVIPQNGGYRLVSGERRLRAYQELKLPTIPARILAGEGSREEILRIQLTENLQREDLDPIDEVNAYVRFFLASHDNLGAAEINNILVTYQRTGNGFTPEIASTVDAISDISGKSISSLRNRLTLLRLPEEVQASLRTGEIPPSQGYILAENPEHPDILAIYKAIVAEPVTNKELKKRLALLVNAAKGGATQQAKPAQPFKGLYTNLHLTTVFEKSAVEALADAGIVTCAAPKDSPATTDTQDTQNAPASAAIPDTPVTPEV